MVVAADHRVAERRSRQQMNRAHHRSHEPLDVAAEMRLRRGPVDDLHSFVLAAHHEGTALELRRIVDVDRLWQSRHRPALVDLAILEPCGLVENRVQKAQATDTRDGALIDT